MYAVLDISSSNHAFEAYCPHGITEVLPGQIYLSQIDYTPTRLPSFLAATEVLYGAHSPFSVRTQLRISSRRCVNIA